MVTQCLMKNIAEIVSSNSSFLDHIKKSVFALPEIQLPKLTFTC